jgi:hypothetical protein
MRQHQGQRGRMRQQSRQQPRRSAGNSSSWSSARTIEGARLVRLQNLALHLGILNSPYFPKNISEYMWHMREMHTYWLGAQRQRVQNRIDGIGHRVGMFLNGKVLEFPRLDWMGSEQEKVWPLGRHPPQVDPQEAWPTNAESKVMGDTRAKAGLERRLPAPTRKLDGNEAAWLVKNGLPIEVAAELMRHS